MKRRLLSRVLVLTAVGVLVLGVVAVPAWAAPGAKNTQISGVGTPGAPGDNGCVGDPLGTGPTYTIQMEGDLEGCIYGYEQSFAARPSGVVDTRDVEIFVGSWGDYEGTFEMREHFTAKFDADGAQLWGRCQHPIVKRSGTGDFEGITGRLDFKDDVVAGVANYRGHLKLGS